MDDTSKHSMSAARAFADAGAEIGMETVKSRRWIFLAAAVVIGVGFPAIGIGLLTMQSDLEPKLFGLAFAVVGVLGSLAALNSYRKLGRFVDLYEQKLTSVD